MKLKLLSVVLFLSCIAVFGQNAEHKMSNDSKPWTRWWWFASIVKPEDVRHQLDWLKSNNFGGVEIAWIYPLNRMQKDTVNYTPRQEWLSPEWSEIVAFTKTYCDKIGLGCDYTFGTLWPFGDSKVPREEGSRTWEDTSFRQDISVSWEYPKKGYVLNHLDRKAFFHYADRLNAALKNAYKGNPSSLFVDSWEVETKTLWSLGLDKLFKKLNDYDITPFMDSLWKNGYEAERYDYFKMISKLVIDEFYTPFVQNAHKNSSFARAQCMGAPTDILKAYSLVDFPETEAMLYEAPFSRVVASAAALSGKNVITSETFTCLYGWPREHLNEENILDLKLVCDALFANGTNQIIWHGTPLNPADIDTVRFYASVHVGEKGNLSKDIKAFNSYMEKVSAIMKKGETYSDVAIYLPLEDSWVAGEYPPELQMKWSWGQYELRYLTIPEEIRGHHPIWVNGDFLDKAFVNKDIMTIGGKIFKSLFIDANYLDYSNLKIIYRIAKTGFPVCIINDLKEPGKVLHDDYSEIMAKLRKLPNVSKKYIKTDKQKPLLEGEFGSYWCRISGEEVYIFFANPMSDQIKYPVKYLISKGNQKTVRNVSVNLFGKTEKLELLFEPNQSVLVKLMKGKKAEFTDINYYPIK